MSDAANPLALDGRRVLVTGAASGIGLATCALLSRLGARVVAVDSDSEGLARASAVTGAAESLSFDLREIELIPAWLADSAQAGGRFAGLVHAAGVSSIVPARLLDPAKYRDVMLVNAEAALALARGFQHKSVCDAAGGSIVFVSSVVAFAGSPGAAAYGMSKAALIGLAKSLAVELAARRIRVNCIAPGFVKTPMYERLAGLWSAEQAAHVEAQHPLGLGEPEDVANAAAFLLADTGRWITGSVMVVDGGYTAQ